jgi:hypothetical protein
MWRFDMMTPAVRRSALSLSGGCLGVLLGAVLLLAAPPARAVDPWVDTGFDSITPRPDADLVLVRERAFESVDLSSLDLGVQDYVQSIYFRFNTGHRRAASFTGIAIFPEGVKILGFVTDEVDLGGSDDDDRMAGADAIFGIDVDPNDYVGRSRGFEYGGQTSSSEFILQDTERSFAFALNVAGGLDDFRVIIDYGDSFPIDLSFDVLAYDLGVVGAAVSSPGIRVGRTDDTVVGNGDFGEVQSLLRIPLTAYEGPEVEPQLE